MPEKPKRKQFRRSISVTGEVYDKLKAYCDAHDRSVSGLVEQLLHRVCLVQALRVLRVSGRPVGREPEAEEVSP